MTDLYCGWNALMENSLVYKDMEFPRIGKTFPNTIRSSCLVGLDPQCDDQCVPMGTPKEMVGGDKSLNLKFLQKISIIHNY